MTVLVQDAEGYTVLIDKRVERDLEGMPNHVTRRFLRTLDEFEKDPFRRRSGFDVAPLRGFPGKTYRLRLGDFRVLFSIDEARREVRITSIAHRSSAYR